MKKTLTTTAIQFCAKQFLRVCASAFFMTSLLFAWQIAKAASPPDASAKPVAAGNYVKGAPIYTAKKTITLDGLMKEVYAGSPLHASILSKALQEANQKILNGAHKMALYSNTPSDWPLRPIPELAIISGFAPLALAGRSSH
jgi:hypothetical protein